MAYNHSPENIRDLISHASSHGIAYTTDAEERSAKAITKYSPASPDEVPLVVFFPMSTQQTSTLLKACNDRRIAVTSFSGGSSFGGALAASRGGVCVSFENMDSVVALHEDDMDVVVQPGIGWMKLNRHIKDKGLFFPVDPAPSASIGGMVSPTKETQC